MQSLYMLSPPRPGVHVVCMLRFNIIIAYTREKQIYEKYKKYKCWNINSQELPTYKVCKHQSPSSQRQPTLPQNRPVSLISPLLRHRNLQEGLHSGVCLLISSWTYHQRTEVGCPKYHTVHPHPSNLHPLTILAKKQGAIEL